jgi:DNA-binding LacI/PurR family transcriptional regulator
MPIARDTAPLYQGIVDDLRTRIGDGRLAPGEQVPTMQELCACYVVSPITAKRAMSELQRLGLVRSVRGKGTYVTQRHELPPLAAPSPLSGVVLMVSFATQLGHSAGFFAPMIEAAELAAREHRLNFRAQTVPEGGSDFHLDLAFRPDPTEAVIFLTTAYPYRIMHLVHEQRLRAVTVDAAHSFSHAILTDNLDGMRQLVDHLRGLGHQRLLLAPRDPHSPNPTNENERTAAFRFLAADRGLTAEVHPAGADAASLLHRLRRPRPPTAILFTQDLPAGRFIRAARAAGLRVPGDVAVTGFDGWCRDPDPPARLTSLAVDRAALGRRAVEFLLTAAAHPSPEWVRVKGRLSLGETTAAP